ncbi:MAG: pseudouridine synthase [Nanoarchaeota archaeon]
MDRVQKIMSNNGFCSRRKAEEFIEDGRVMVNGKVISLGDKASVEDVITIDGKKLEKREMIYVKFHKPVGCVTALNDRYEKTIMDYIKIKERVFPVGRLDKDTSGLLLLTNDGDFANHITHPSHEVKKTYLAGLYQDIEDNKLDELRKGVMLSDGKTRPAKIIKHHSKLIEVEIHEGRNRIIKRMFEAVGYEVKFLKRVRIGKLNLGELPEGRYAFLKTKEGKWPEIV